jgi:hypothetical protein
VVVNPVLAILPCMNHMQSCQQTAKKAFFSAWFWSLGPNPILDQQDFQSPE